MTTYEGKRVVVHTNRIERVYSQLYDMIVSGELGQGVRLIEREIAAKFSVSRMVVRDVIKQMARDGLVKWNRKGQYARPVVAPLIEREMEELHEIVAALETLAARRCAAWPGKKRVKLVKELKAINSQLAQLCQQEPLDLDKVVQCDHAFHSAYSTKGAGPRVSALRRVVKPQSMRYHRAYLPAYISQASEGLAEHENIISAIAEGSEEKADHAVRTHWLNAAERLSKVMALWNPERVDLSGHA